MEFQCLRRDPNSLVPARHPGAAFTGECFGLSSDFNRVLAPTFVERVNEYLDGYKRAHVPAAPRPVR
jgi:hypothetical protein